MVLAAGLGTRLRPLTNDRPKALVEVAGRTMLDLTLARLRAFGVHDVIVNVHHFGDHVVDYLRAHQNFGMHIAISREAVLLDTGGGVKQAAWFFQQQSANEPFLLHNVDILSSFDLSKLIRFHREHDALATLATQARTTSRPLLFDRNGQLKGRAAANKPSIGSQDQPLAFAGIHVLSPNILDRLQESPGGQTQPFSIIESYLRLAGQGERILSCQDDDAYWCDLGKPESVAQAAADILRRPQLAP